MRFPTRIPTSIGILLLAIIFVSFVFVFESLSRQQTGATGSSQPENVQITNVSDTMFTVTWTTTKDSKGALVVSSEGKRKQTYFDDRDSDGKLNRYSTHSVTVRGLVSNTTHNVSILSDGKTYNNDGRPFQIQTGPTITSGVGRLAPAFGTVIQSDNPLHAQH